MTSVDKVIQILREMMIANAPGTSGAFSSKGDPLSKAGLDPVMDGRSKVMRRLPKPYSKFLRQSTKKR